MNSHRFNGVPINLDTLGRAEVIRLNVYAHQHLGKALGEVAIINKFMGDHGYYSVPDVPEPEHDPFNDWPDSVRIEPS